MILTRSVVFYPFIKAEGWEAESVGNHVPTIIYHDMHSSHQGCDSLIENKHDIQEKVILSWADFKKQVIAAYLIVISG